MTKFINLTKFMNFTTICKTKRFRDMHMHIIISISKNIKCAA